MVVDGPVKDWGAKLQPDSTLPVSVRFGAYLRSIPPSNRIGDYVHCAGRVANVFLKRLVAMSLSGKNEILGKALF